MGRRFVAARINVWLARTPENMRTNYVWTDDPRAAERPRDTQRPHP